jgi:hypothetical protein
VTVIRRPDGTVGVYFCIDLGSGKGYAMVVWSSKGWAMVAWWVPVMITITKSAFQQ